MSLNSTAASLLGPQGLEELDQMLVQHGGPFNLSTAHGLLCALVTNPNLPLGDHWFLAAFAEKKKHCQNHEWKHFIKQILQLKDEIVMAFSEGKLVVPLINYEQQYLPGLIRKNKGLQKNLASWCDVVIF